MPASRLAFATRGTVGLHGCAARLVSTADLYLAGRHSARPPGAGGTAGSDDGARVGLKGLGVGASTAGESWSGSTLKETALKARAGDQTMTELSAGQYVTRNLSGDWSCRG